MHRAATRVLHRLFVVVLLAATGLGWADTARGAGPVEPRMPAPDWIPIAPAALDAMRGGYDMPSGLSISVGFERVAYVNGVLVSSVRVEVADVTRLTARQAQQLARLQQVELVQLGAGNVFQAVGGAGLVIQNSLDNQSIAVHTTIDAAVGTLGLLQAINAADALRDAGIGAMGTP